MFYVTDHCLYIRLCSVKTILFLSAPIYLHWRLFPSVSPSITVELRYKKSLIQFKILCSSCREQQIKAQSTNHANIQSINLSKHARHTYWPIGHLGLVKIEIAISLIIDLSFLIPSQFFYLL